MSEDIFVPGTCAVPPRGEIGGKAHSLATLSALAARPDSGFAVPRWFAIRALAFERLVRAASRDSPDPEASREALRGAEPPPALRASVRRGLEELSPGARVAVRSSAVGEDGALASFAGQFDSVLGVKADEESVWDAVRRVWASAWSAHAAAYAGRHAAAEGGFAVSMAVVIQEMARADAAGVAFSADPVSGDRGVTVVGAVPGLGERLVSGELDADTFRVAIAGRGARIVERRIVAKETALRLTAEGTASEPIPASMRDAPALSDDEAIRIARCTHELERAFGCPQDVEWAIERRPGEPARLLVLQARPITTLGGRPKGPAERPASAERTAAPNPGPARQPAPATPPRRGERRLWDNSNIIESYSGVTTPLTFSFARAVYEDAYRQFLRIMGVSESLIASHAPVLANMLGLIRGRVYYNLLNWYRMLALLPGFSFNRGFMERMMGVRERLEDPPPPPGSGRRLLDLARLVKSLAAILWQARRLPREVPAFHARVESRLAPLAGRDLTTAEPGEILALYRRLEDELLHHWRAPLVNDFFAMMFFGALCQQIERWMPEAPPTLANDLLCGEGGIISTEPARAVMDLARALEQDAALAARFLEVREDAELWRVLHAEPAHAAFASRLDAYVARFGDRCMNELKLETLTLREDPAFLLQTIRNYVRGGTIDAEAARAREVAIRREAEARARARLGRVRRALFLWVLAQARARVRDRENLRFERTRVFGIVRRMFLALGAHHARTGRLDDPRDIFLLTVPEVFADLEGTGASADLRAVVRARRAEFEACERAPAPPDRFETWGPPAEWLARVPVADRSAATSMGDGRELRGLGCCPGVVRAPVRIIHDPHQARDLNGHILVAERTDPGWTLLFPVARGLLVQRGSLLSHSAIVAREMGLPCVVGIAGLLAALRDDELVEMDGTAGTVRRLGVPG